MGINKRIWIENDPAYEDVRRKHQQEREQEFERLRVEYPIRLATTRFHTVDGKRQKNWFWNMSLMKALSDLDADTIQINEGIFFRTEQEREEVCELSEKHLLEWQRRLERR